MEQLSFFDTSDSYWCLYGDVSEKMFFHHSRCGYTFPFAGYGYRIKPVCPKCGTPMTSFYCKLKGGD